MGVWDPSLRACPTQGLSSLQQPRCWLRAEQEQVGRELNNKLAFSRGFHLFYFKFLPVSACRAHQRRTGRQHARHCLTAASLTRKPTQHEPLRPSRPPAPQPVPMVARGSVVLPEWVGITHQFGTSSPALPGSAQPRESLGQRTSRLLGLSWERGAAAWHPEQNRAPRAGFLGSGRVGPYSSSTCGHEGKQEGARCTWGHRSGQAEETGLLQARHPGTLLQGAEHRGQHCHRPRLRGCWSQGMWGRPRWHLLLRVIPWLSLGTKGNSEDRGAGSRVLGSRAGPRLAAALNPSALTPTPALGTGCPPAHSSGDMAQLGAALVAPVLCEDTTVVPGKLSNCCGCSSTNGPNCPQLH